MSDGGRVILCKALDVNRPDSFAQSRLYFGAKK